MDAAGSPAQLVRTLRALRLLRECHRLLVRERDEAVLLRGVARMVVEVGGYRMAWIGLVRDDAARSVEPVAFAGHDEGYVAGLRVSWDGASDRGRGPVGLCIRGGAPVVVRDVEEPSLLPWREAALRRGYRAMAALPLEGEAGAHALGALAAYADEPRVFDVDEVELLHDLARDLAFALRAIRGEARHHELEASLAEGEEELRRRDQDYRTVLQTSMDGFTMVDRSGAIVEVNDAACRLLGEPREALLGRRLSELTAAGGDARLAQRQRSGASVVRIRHVRRDGSWVDLEVSASFVEGTDARVAAFLRDVTDEGRAAEALRATQEQLLQAQKLEAVGRLAGGIAHDFNNLLTAITGYADLLASELDPGDPRREDAAEISRAGQRAAALTRQLLLFSRRDPPALETLDLAEAMGALAHMLRRLLGEDVRLATRFGPATVRADRGQLEQLVMNLAVNARDAMPAGGELSLSTGPADAPPRAPLAAAPEGWALLRVRDTGLGMTEEVRRHLFEPFFTTKERGKGTGLGLATVYGIVRGLGGAIEVETAPGRGTTFSVFLPLAPGGRPERGAAEAERPPAAAPAPGATVLVVEDEESVRRLVVKVLGERGYAVLGAADGSEALRHCEGHAGRIDLVLTDVVMPGMSGGEVARAASRLRPEARVLYMSGHAEDVLARQDLAGARAPLLRKPFTPEALLRAVADALAPRADG